MNNYIVYNSYAITAAGTFGGILYGIGTITLSPFLETKAYIRYFNPNSQFQAILVGGVPLGAVCTSLVGGILANKLGRKNILLLSSILWIIAYLILCLSRNVVQLLIGRIITGFSLGFSSSQIPVLLAELAPRKIRGRIVACFQFANCAGMMLVFYIGLGCSYIQSTLSFRLAWCLMIIPGLFFFFTILILPESPRILALKGKREEAEYIIAMINAKGDLKNPIVQSEVKDLNERFNLKQSSFVRLFSRKNRIKTFTGITIMVWQQSCGMNLFMYYIVYILTTTGRSGQSMLIMSSCQYAINTLMTIPALIFIDSWGRRPIFFWGMLLMFITNISIGILMQINGYHVPDYRENVSWIVGGQNSRNAIIILNLLFVCIFATTWGPAAYVYVAEIFPNDLRSKANGLCICINWAFNFATAIYTPIALYKINFRIYYMFASFCFIALLQAFFLLPETNKRSFYEISVIFDNTGSIWKQGIWRSKYEQDDELVTDKASENLKEKPFDIITYEKSTISTTLTYGTIKAITTIEVEDESSNKVSESSSY